MRRFVRWTAGACVLAALAPPPALAQNQDTAIGRAEIAMPITVIDGDDMDFGKIVPRANAGTVVLAPGATATCTTTGGLVRTGNCRAARFNGTVSFLFNLSVQRPNGNRIDLTGPNGATMRVENFTFGSAFPTLYQGAQGANHRFTILSPSGDYTFYVGGTLRVGANQRPGIYTGTFDVRLNYD